MIFVECNADETLLFYLGLPRRRIIHCKGKGEVVTRVKRADGSAVGMIDEDPDRSQPSDLRNYEVLENADGLKLTKRNDGNKYLIVIPDELEVWLYSRAGHSNISPKKFGLPATPEELKKLPHFEKRPGFRKLLKELIDKDGQVPKLKIWIEDVIP